MTQKRAEYENQVCAHFFKMRNQRLKSNTVFVEYFIREMTETCETALTAFWNATALEYIFLFFIFYR